MFPDEIKGKDLIMANVLESSEQVRSKKTVLKSLKNREMCYLEKEFMVRISETKVSQNNGPLESGDPPFVMLWGEDT